MSYPTRILGLESSCDDTAAAVVLDGCRILSNVISSQDDLHRRFGGVVPEVASRRHLEMINPIIDEALARAGIALNDLTAIGVSHGPGLVGSLLVGVSTAKALAYALDVPLVAVNHLEGHIYANFLTGVPIIFPLLCLVVSGGHTSLIYMRDHGELTILGRTRDDAAGEVFDKVARALSLGFPGGPVIEKLARDGDAAAFTFPRALMNEGGKLDFSFSGLKTAVLNCIRREQEQGRPVKPEDLCAAFQAAVVDVLVEKTALAARSHAVRQLLLAGGVAANSELRRNICARMEAEGVEVVVPPPHLCTDNGAMIGAAAYFALCRGRVAEPSLNAVANLTLGGN